MSENNGYEALPLISDTPVFEGERRDQLGFQPTARVLADSMVATPEPLTIGIFGEWGTGKTSTMRLIEKEIRSYSKNAIAVWFNAWQYEKEEHLIVPLTATIEQEIAEHLESDKFDSSIVKGAKKLREALRAVAYGISVKGKVGVPTIAEANINLSPKEMIDRYQELTKDSVIRGSLYFDAFKKLSDLAQKTDEMDEKGEEIKTPRIVVLVDDLDRCFPNKAVELLEGIKLVLHQPGFSFVIGINDKIIDRFIRTKYEKEFDLDGSYFEQYLDKIVQVKVPVPDREPESKEMEKYVKKLLKSEIFEKEKDIEAVVPLVAHACKHNPRSIVRMLNRVMITSQINKLEGSESNPLALLIQIAIDESDFSMLQNSLSYPVKKDDTTTIGEYLAEIFSEYNDDEENWFDDQINNAQECDSQTLINTLELLQESKHMCNVFQHEIGRQYLENAGFSSLQKSASSKTIGDRKVTNRIDEVDPGVADIIKQIEENMVKIPTNKFMMGSEKEEEEQPVHEVSIDTFYMSKYQVTQIEYETIMGENPSRFKGINNPIERISWKKAKLFCERLSRMSGKKYRLPTEAEWEYACRAGSTTDYCFGNDKEELKYYAWFNKNSNYTHPVGELNANQFELHDMHGNVWEWCEDDWHNNYDNAPKDGKAWINKPRSNNRVLRGGSFSRISKNCRSAVRNAGRLSVRSPSYGFRLVR